MNQFRNIIVAPVTAMVNQTVGIIRLSGSNVFALVAQIVTKPFIAKGSTFCYRQIMADKTMLDEVLLLFFQAPYSFTGEDVVEIHCHGNIYVVEKIIALLLAKGASLAKKGEFSERAFWNNKLSLIKADAINDLIKSNNPHATQMFVNKMQIPSHNELQAMQTELLDLISNMEVNIDYPEYDGVGHLTNKAVALSLAKLAAQAKTIMANSTKASLIANGIDVMILGAPNVGKSSLLNKLLAEEKAIVSDIAGTTRDIVEGTIRLPHVTLRLLDTAGIRTTTNKIETIGVKKALSLLKKVHFVIVMFDASKEKLTNTDEEILQLARQKQHLIILNKTDLGRDLQKNYHWEQNTIPCSLQTDNITKVTNAISNIFQFTNIINHPLVFIHEHQKQLLHKIQSQLAYCVVQHSNLSFDLLSRDLQEVWEWLCELTGDHLNETILETMFRNYCLGK